MNQLSTNAYSHRRTRTRQKQKRTHGFLAALLGLFLLAGGILFLATDGAHLGQRLSTNSWVSGATQLVSDLAGSDASSEDKLSYILNHPEEYTDDLIELAQKNSEALDYVYQYPQLKNQTQTIDLSAEADSTQVPLLLQWDTRWGYQEYGSGLIGYTGCGPTCLSMVALYLTGNTDYSPAYVADYALNHGYYVSGSGTAWSLMSEGCAAFGITARELALDEGVMVAALSAGTPIICSMGPGDFTDNGHFIVLTGYTGDGFTVNDPNSPQRSSQIWTFQQLKGQIRNLWAYGV
jgi:hypothetical protein